MKTSSWVWTIWGEGRWIDVWSINHLLSGSLLACFVFLKGEDPWIGLGVSFLIMVAWELFEVVRGIHEFFWNRVMDLMIGTLGYLVTIDIVQKLQRQQVTMTLAIVLLIFFVLEIWGYLAYRFRVSHK